MHEVLFSEDMEGSNFMQLVQQLVRTKERKKEETANFMNLIHLLQTTTISTNESIKET